VVLVFQVQANFIQGGLLLTFSGQHGSMDMTGLGRVIHLLAKACRKDTFTESDLTIGNMNRKLSIPLLEKDSLSSNPPDPISNDHPAAEDRPQSEYTPPPQAPLCIWSYFVFSCQSLAALKSLAMSTLQKDSHFISTDDALSAFAWQSISRARISRLERPSGLNSSLSRNVDVRRYFSLPLTYPGLIVSSTLSTLVISDLVNETLGGIAAPLRKAIDPVALKQETMVNAAATRNPKKQTPPQSVAISPPSLDIRLSSWAKEDCYNLDFGPSIGQPEAVRRPRFMDGAREGLVYFLPKTVDGEISFGIFLRDEDMERLRRDELFAKYGTYIG
jgi:hypothetical protein